MECISFKGDLIEKRLPYLLFLMSLGAKHVPFPNAHSIIVKQISNLKEPMSNLRCVLTWSVFYQFCDDENQHHKAFCPPVEVFPSSVVCYQRNGPEYEDGGETRVQNNQD